MAFLPAQTSGGTLTFAQLEALWEGQGGSPQLAPTMAAIAEAESGGNPSAINPTDPNGGSYGLWQINPGSGALGGTGALGSIYPQSTPSFTGAPGAYSSMDTSTPIFTPTTNAAAAVQVAGDGSVGALDNWSTYASGAYKKFLAGNMPIATTTFTGGSGQASSPQTSAATDPSGNGSAPAPTSILDPKFWSNLITGIEENVFLFGIALVLVLGGFLWLAASNKTVQEVASKVAEGAVAA